jgi:hypothetical protein
VDWVRQAEDRDLGCSECDTDLQDPVRWGGGGFTGQLKDIWLLKEESVCGVSC